MRKESILILLFLCFGFLSCDDFGIKSIDTGMYIMLPANIDKNEIKVYIDGKETMLFDKFSIDENKNFSSEQIFASDSDNIFDTKFINEFEEYKRPIIYVMNSDYLETSKNYKDEFLIEINNDGQNPEKFSFVFAKNQLKAMNDYRYEDLSFDSENGKIYCLFFYYYTVSI